MADIAARREARRRRILENSENRLQIISGLNKTDVPGDVPLKKVTDFQRPEPLDTKNIGDIASEFGGESPINFHTEVLSKEVRYLNPSFTLETHSQDPSLHQKLSFVSSENSEQKTEDIQSFFSTALSARLHLVGLALIVRVLLSLNFGYLFGESIFVPLGTVQVVKYFGIASQSSTTTANSGMLGAALILSGISPQQISHLNKIIGVAKACLQDFYIYFFSFIIMHVILDYLYS